MNPLEIDKARIETRIKEIEQKLDFLKNLLEEYPKIKFLTDDLVASGAERNLQIAIQACLDVADYLVAKLKLRLPKKDKKEVFRSLSQKKIISENLADRLIKMAGMRNILVHEYLEIEREKIYQAIKNDLGDIVKFVSAIQKFLDKSASLIK